MVKLTQLHGGKAWTKTGGLEKIITAVGMDVLRSCKIDAVRNESIIEPIADIINNIVGTPWTLDFRHISSMNVDVYKRQGLASMTSQNKNTVHSICILYTSRCV